MEHEVLADEAAAVGEAVRELRRGGVEQDAGGADAVAGEHHHLCALMLFLAVFVVVDHAVRHAVGVDRDLAHPATRPEFHAAAQGDGPIGDVGARLGALGAAGRARPQVLALVAALVRAGYDGAVGRPPVPAELVEAAGDGLADAAEGQRRQGRLLGRIGRISGEAGDAHHAVVLGEVGLQGVVVHGPVVGHAVQGFHSKIRWMQAWKCAA